ncbi:MAG TPA: hypothetical protein VHB25_00585 [Gemmatimonadaceae bacterium]|nr:hypothetical protein [Gemmatimonadaceae bacterium]
MEDAVDSLAAAYVPGYSSLAENRDFSLSMRIELVRSLRLCPTRLLGAADAVRLIRNDFAHELSIATFDACKPKHLASIRGHLQQIQPAMVKDKSDREVFVNLVGMVRMALRGYSFHVDRLNTYVRTVPEFRESLRQHCVKAYPQVTPKQG